MRDINDYINQTREEIKVKLLTYLDEYELPHGGSHPIKQKQAGGNKLHTLEVVEMALKLNQQFDPQEIIETCLIHDLKHWREFPLKENQILAIKATKGLPWETWRHTPHFRFVALILIADMWSAYVNELSH
jgi:hypothetical protein